MSSHAQTGSQPLPLQMLAHDQFLKVASRRDPTGTYAPGRITDEASGFVRLTHEAERWRFTTEITRIDHHHCKGVLTAQYRGAESDEISIQLKLAIAPAGKPRWMVPGILYKENRPEDCIRTFPYPRYDYHATSRDSFDSNYWAFRSDRCPTPAVICWTNTQCIGAAIGEQCGGEVTGVGFQGSEEQTCIYLNVPYREQPRRYTFGLESTDPVVAFMPVQPGQQLQLTFYLYQAEPNLHAYHQFLKFLYAQWRDDSPTHPWMPTQQASELMAYGLYAWHYDRTHHALYETAAFDANCSVGLRQFRDLNMRHVDRPHMHVGWVSGIPTALGLLTYGRDNGAPNYVDAAVAVIDKIADEGISPIGCFWPEWTYENGWGTGWNPKPNWIHARTISEAVLFLIRAIAFEAARGHAHPNWQRAVRTNLEFVLSKQDHAGNCGTYYDTDTGNVVERQGTAGILWAAALAEAAASFSEPTWLDAAVKAGHYYKRFVEDEYLFGAPEDVHLTPTSEDGYNGLIAYMALYEATHDDPWLALAQRAADWTLTFRFAYNVRFPEHTFLQQYDFRTTGGDLGSVSNQHIHNYGMVCLPELLKLWQLTADDYYFERSKDHLFCFLQTIARRDGDLNARRGMISEQWYTTDWAFHKGSMTQVSHSWCLGLPLLAHHAIRASGSVIVDRTKQHVYCLEPLQAELVHSADKTTLRIHNPFDVDQRVSVSLRPESTEPSPLPLQLLVPSRQTVDINV
jgi:rhamnogalacturonyl hydrolase YesR